jgi:hypothetical protein
MEFIIPIIGGLILYAIISELVKAPGKSLQRKFLSLGTLTGKSKSQIISVVGQPNSISGTAGGKTLCQWMATGYHIALIFNGEICEGVTHEFRV